MTLESEIEVFLARNPYLIHRSFAAAQVKRQVRRDRDRLDLLIEKKGKATIVEIKKTVLDAKAVQQLLRYLERFGKDLNLGPTHYLVGLAPQEARLPRQTGIKLLFLGRNIPLRFLYDNHVRRYVKYDERLAANPIRFDSEIRFNL